MIIYIHNFLKFNIVPTNITTSNWDCLTVDVLHRLNSKHILTINNIYNRPYNTVENLVTFLTEFNTFIRDRKLVNHLSILAGDFDINLPKLKKNSRYND